MESRTHNYAKISKLYSSKDSRIPASSCLKFPAMCDYSRQHYSVPNHLFLWYIILMNTKKPSVNGHCLSPHTTGSFHCLRKHWQHSSPTRFVAQVRIRVLPQ